MSGGQEWMQACSRKPGLQHPRVFQFATFGEFQDALQCFALLSFYVGEGRVLVAGEVVFIYLFSSFAK